MAYLNSAPLGMVLPSLAALGSICFATPLLAESGPAPCLPGRVIEVFPGAPGCEDADYVVLQIEREGLVDYGDHSASDVDWWDACRETIAWADYATVGLRALDAGVSDLVLVGTASVRTAFGIEPDVLIDEPSPLSIAGGEVNTCSDAMTFGFGSEVSAPDVGMALSADPQGGWSSSEPRPINQRGAIGTFTGCDIPDASVAEVPTEEPLCFNLEPEVAPVEPGTDVSPGTGAQEPETLGTPGSDDGEPVTESVVEPDTDESEPSSRTDMEPQTATSGDGAGSSDDDALNDSADSDSLTQSQGSREARDAGLGPAGSLNPVSEAATDGCTCHLGYAGRSRSVLYLLPLLALALRFRRRKTRK